MSKGSVSVTDETFRRTSTREVGTILSGRVIRGACSRFGERVTTFIRTGHKHLGCLVSRTRQFMGFTTTGFSRRRVIVSFSKNGSSAMATSIIAGTLDGPRLARVFKGAALRFPCAVRCTRHFGRTRRRYF